MRGALLGAVFIAALVPAAANARCDLCQLHLQSRRGPYTIVIKRLPRSLPDGRPRIAVRLTNHSGVAVVVGGGRTSPSRVMLNVIGSRSNVGVKTMEPLDVAPGGRTVILRPGATIAFKGTDPAILSGQHRLNVTYRNVDSNILSYTARLTYPDPSVEPVPKQH